MSEFLVPMKSKKANPKDSSSPHSSSSGLFSKGLTTTAGVPNKETDNLVNISDGTESQFEKYGNHYLGEFSAKLCSGNGSCKTSGVCEVKESSDTTTETENHGGHLTTENLKDKIMKKLKEFVLVTSSESMASDKDSFEKAHNILDEAIEENRLYFQSILNDTEIKTGTRTTTEDFFLRHSKVHPLDFCLLKSFVEFGGDVVTGSKAITGLRTLLEQKQKLTKLTHKLHDLYQCKINRQKAHRYVRVMLKRKKLKVDPGVFWVNLMCNKLLDIIQQIAELNKPFNTIYGIPDNNITS